MNQRHGLSAFGQQLRHWRRRSGLSQLALALKAGTTPRHISFIETGRSRPGRDLILRLCGVLDVPVRERNSLLISAGLPAAFPSRDLADEAMRSVKLVLDCVLQGHEPYPAWVVGRGMQFLASNCGAEAVFTGMCSLPPEEIRHVVVQTRHHHQVRTWQVARADADAGVRRRGTRPVDR
jgi:transcriptional regulator with XRE-family HTH domain